MIKFVLPSIVYLIITYLNILQICEVFLFHCKFLQCLTFLRVELFYYQTHQVALLLNMCNFFSFPFPTK